MPFKKEFQIRASWKSDPELVQKKLTRFSRNHVIVIDGKPELQMSSAKAFKGDGSKHNPEDLLLSSLSSCHMMSYLYVCAQEGIRVLEYEDHATGELLINNDGSGMFTKVELSPKVKIENASNLERAHELHVRANELCFIANSCNFPVLHEAEVVAN